MARVVLAPEVLEDFDRFFAHMASFDVVDAAERIADIIQAIDILSHSPLIGRPARSGKCELVIGRGARGYIALYRFVSGIDSVFVLALRNQREVGQKHGQ